MRAIVEPSRAHGTVSAPPSKSMAHRLLICAGLSADTSVIHSLAMSDDIMATIGCLRSLGADIRLSGDTAYVRGVDPGKISSDDISLYCHESGSTLRFFTPLCMLSGSRCTLSGKPYLFTRPMSVYEDIAAEQGIQFRKSADNLTVKGRLKPGVYDIPGDISSQFISGLLFALPMLDGDSEIRVLPPFESRPYVDMTIGALRGFGIEVEQDGDNYYIKGSQRYRGAELTVEGDHSNAAFFEALNCAGSQVTVTGLDPESAQGDKIFKILYKNIRDGVQPIDITDCPDLGPILFAVAALCGTTEFIGTRRLKLKESDRAEAMREELMKFGAELAVGENSVTVMGGELTAPSQPLNAHNDHRIAMTLAVLASVTGGIIEGAECVSKSFPDFFDRIKDLGIEVVLCSG